MRTFRFAAALVLAVSLTASLAAHADNPIVQTIYTADPAPLVVGDTVYLYTGHDEDASKYFTMKDWRCFSSKDMVNWTDHGSPLSIKSFAWARADAWAGQVIERKGKFYYYVPMNRKGGGMSIGVAVADSPTGPFTDALNKPLVANGEGNIDPTVYIDDDGQAYLYWGNPKLKYVKLNEDMISFDQATGIVEVPLTVESFGKREKDPKRATLYEEGPWFYKRTGTYYMVYAASGIPENIAYATGPGPTGPWSYNGIIMPTAGKSFTNHPGLVDFKGHCYFFYHDGGLPGGGGFTRSVCLEEFTYNPDGSFPTIKMSKSGPAAIGHLNPYERTEAETICWESGIKTATSDKTGVFVTDIDDNDFIKVKSVDFADGAASFAAGVASAGSGGTIELHLDDKTGPLVGTLAVPNTGGTDSWKTVTTSITQAQGIHDLFFVFKGQTGAHLFTFDHWMFNKAR